MKYSPRMHLAILKNWHTVIVVVVLMLLFFQCCACGQSSEPVQICESFGLVHWFPFNAHQNSLVMHSF